MSALLQVRDLHIAFGDQAVVHGIGFAIQPGEKLALVGESGSGKSVSALALLGLAQGAQVRGQALLQRPQGAMDLLGASARSLQQVRGQDIAMVFQEPMTALNPLLTIGQQIAEVLQLKVGLSRMDAWFRAIELIAETGIQEAARRARSYPHQLSGGQRQRAMIAMALAAAPRLLLADEPTTALDVALRAQILELLAAQQRARGMAVLLITHDLPLVRRFADRVLVLERGCIVEQGTVAEVFAAPQHPYTRRLLQATPQRDLRPVAADAAPLVESQALRVTYAVPRPGLAGWWRRGEFVAVQGASLQVRAGETVGVVGESGSGKSTLALAVLGLVPAAGAVTVRGQAWSGRNAQDRPLRRAIQVVFQDPYSALSPRLTLEGIVGEGLQVHEPALALEPRRERVRAALAEVGLDEAQFPGLLQRYAHQFSGGQRQRIAIARALIVQPQVLVLDEPTSALDVTMGQQILALLQRLQRERGLAYLLITHDVGVVRAMAHRVLVLQDGVVVESGPVEQVLERPSHAYTRALVADSA